MEIQGHYENGKIVPRQGISLPNGTEVTIIVRDQPRWNPNRMTDEERRRYLAGLARIDALPDENPSDTYSGRDHDRALYGDGS